MCVRVPRSRLFAPAAAGSGLLRTCGNPRQLVTWYSLTLRVACHDGAGMVCRERTHLRWRGRCENVSFVLVCFSAKLGGVS